MYGKGATSTTTLTVTLPKTTSIQITKVQTGSNNPIAGAKFQLYKSDEKTTVQGEKTSDKNGVVKWSDLTYDSTKDTKYVIVETKAATGFELPANPKWTVTTSELKHLRSWSLMTIKKNSDPGMSRRHQPSKD